MRTPSTLLTRTLLAFALMAPLEAATYYVDCASGSDSASGLSQSQPWRTVAKASTMQFVPGDSILLKRGARCEGQLWPKGSGEEGRPIRVGAYGAGALPVIEGGSAAGAIRLFNQHHWEIETLDASGGTPYGIHISGSEGTLRHFVLRNVVVHGATGEPKRKTSGLVVITTSGSARMEDVLIDGVTAYDTTQWAGIIVSGASRENRIHNVTIRNSIVHDVYGDGIVLFSVQDGLIEKSAAWLTGLQPRETIGTPNGIWTWTCLRCTVRLTEGFFIDSPGVDGGVYDIDWGNDENIVEDNYGHDAQGYCAAVFAAGKRVTTNSVIRRNLCIDNGRSPKLARRQGDLYISTWDGGALDGVRIEDNTFYWSPPNDVPLVQMDRAEFTGSRPNVVSGNRMYTGVSSPVHASEALKLEPNTIGPAPEALTPPPASGKFRLVLTGADRSQVVFLQAALAQYANRLDAVVAMPNPSPELVHDWHLGRIRLEKRTGAPGVKLISPEGRAVAQWPGFVAPAELGLALRRADGCERLVGVLRGEDHPT